MRRRIPFTLIFIIIIILLGVWIVIPNNPGIHLGPMQKDIKTLLGLDLVGGVQALLEADLPADVAIPADQMDTARIIVENRVNGLGVTEAVVQQAGDRRIVVELPGESDPERALAAIKQTGLLEFVDFSELSSAEVNSLELQIIKTDYKLTQTPASTPDTPLNERVFHTVLTGADLKSDQIGVTTTQTNEPQVAFALSDDAAKIFDEFTANNIGKSLAIVLDKQVLSAPVISNRIPDGQGVITGNYTVDTANELAIQLRYGSLPVPLKVVTSQTIGPTLGQDSLQKSLIAGIIGITVVMIYMGLYYRLNGLIADIALLIYALISLAIFKFIPVTLTLPSIAGFILSIGVAVDANVLIFERMKEELRDGKTLRQAIDAGWSRAWLSIRDSNISTLITCAILFWFGSAFGASIVKGFSLTLAIGVGVSMFTAIIVTRTILHLVLDNINVHLHVGWFGVQES